MTCTYNISNNRLNLNINVFLFFCVFYWKKCLFGQTIFGATVHWNVKQQHTHTHTHIRAFPFQTITTTVFFFFFPCHYTFNTAKVNIFQMKSYRDSVHLTKVKMTAKCLFMSITFIFVLQVCKRNTKSNKFLFLLVILFFQSYRCVRCEEM